jgi:DNA-binding MarR family transcriptional regulator
MIIRAAKNRNYTVINNTVLNDDRLSLKARGLAAYLLTKPDDWRINRDLLASQFPDGVWAVRGALKELERAGYLSRTRHQNNGRFTWEITLHEIPILPVVENQPVDETPVVEKQPIEKQPIENQPSIVSTEVVSTDVPSTVKATTDDDDRATAKIVAEKLEKAGVILSPLLMDKYMDMVATYGLRPVLYGIDRAVGASLQHKFNYVAACARNNYQGIGFKSNGNGAVDGLPPIITELTPRERTVEDQMWDRLSVNPAIAEQARRFGTFEGEVYVPRGVEYKRARHLVSSLNDLGIEIRGQGD